MDYKPYQIGMFEVADDPTVRHMFERRRFSGNTRKVYLEAVRSFCECLGVKPKDALVKVKAMREGELFELFDGWFVRLGRNVAPKTAYLWLTGVSAWLEENGFDLEPFKRRLRRQIVKYAGRPERILKRDIITKEEIVKILHHAELRERALITLLASSGLRIEKSALKLKVKHFKDDLWDKKLPCYALEIPEELTKAPNGEEEPHITFISAEAAAYLREYIEWRRIHGERISEESWLFTAKESVFNRDVFENPKPMAYSTSAHMWHKLCMEAGIDRKPVNMKAYLSVKSPGGGRRQIPLVRYNIRIHSLRKYFKTSCSTHNVDRMAAEAMMGHTLRSFGIESVYDYCVSNLEFLREQYMKALPAFTFLAELPSIPAINGEARQRIEQLQAILAEKELELQALKSRLQEVESVKSKMEKFEAYLTDDILNVLRRLAEKRNRK